jgi:hypothetical protein
LTSGLQELAKRLTYAAVVIGGHVDSSDAEMFASKLGFISAFEKWQARYMPG